MSEELMEEVLFSHHALEIRRIVGKTRERMIFDSWFPCLWTQASSIKNYSFSLSLTLRIFSHPVLMVIVPGATTWFSEMTSMVRWLFYGTDDM
jgi:hypothetical protein